jgi:hypothetical protein
MNKSTFESIDELIRLYQQQGVLTNGLNDSLPREPWFRGDFDDAEATSCLQFTPPGTFLVRFDPARKGYAFVVSFVGADRAIQHVPVHADDKGVFRAFSFGLTSPPENAAKTVRDVVDANALALRVPAPRDDGFAEERALDPFASFDATDEGKRSSLGGFVASGNDLDNDDDDDDDELRGLNVYQPLPGLTKKANPLATSLSKPRHARTPSGEKRHHRVRVRAGHQADVAGPHAASARQAATQVEREADGERRRQRSYVSGAGHAEAAEHEPRRAPRRLRGSARSSGRRAVEQSERLCRSHRGAFQQVYGRLGARHHQRAQARRAGACVADSAARDGAVAAVVVAAATVAIGVVGVDTGSWSAAIAAIADAAASAATHGARWHDCAGRQRASAGATAAAICARVPRLSILSDADRAVCGAVRVAGSGRDDGLVSNRGRIGRIESVLASGRRQVSRNAYVQQFTKKKKN